MSASSSGSYVTGQTDEKAGTPARGACPLCGGERQPAATSSVAAEAEQGDGPAAASASGSGGNGPAAVKAVSAVIGPQGAAAACDIGAVVVGPYGAAAASSAGVVAVNAHGAAAASNAANSTTAVVSSDGTQAPESR